MDLLKVSATADPAIYRLVGELDLSTLHNLLSVPEPPSGSLTLDFANLRFIDGAGLDTLAALARSLPGKLVVENPRPPLEKLIRKVVIRDRLANLVIHNVPVGDDEGGSNSWDPSFSLVTEHAPESLCRSLVASAGRVMDSPVFTSVSLMEVGKPEVVAFDHPVAEELDNLQFRLGAGPVVQVMEARNFLDVPSLIEERRWPDFTNDALYRGVASVASIPMVAGDEVLGAMSLYGQKERVFSGNDLKELSLLVTQTSVAIANASAYWNAKELIRQLQEALESRAVIDQAKGILMATEGVSAEDAFQTLRRASQRGNLKVRDLARRVVESSARGTGGRHDDAAKMSRLSNPLG